MPDPRLPIAWTPRAVPLSARGVVAVGAAAGALGRRLLDLDDDALGSVTGVAGDAVLVVLGEAGRLPWVEGVVYLGRDPEAPDLLLPTTLVPTVPLAALAHALLRRFPEAPRPIAALPAPARAIPCGGTRPIDRGRLATWCAEVS